jgi:hypothetical protein
MEPWKDIGRWVVESDGDGGQVLALIDHCGRRSACTIFGVSQDGQFYREAGTFESAPAAMIVELLKRAGQLEREDK